MTMIKRFVPNKLKNKVRHLIYKFLKIEYSASGVPIEIIKKLPNNIPINFIDIGANIGSFSKKLGSQYSINKGILIEPINSLIPELIRNFSNKNKFTILNCAVSDIESETDFFLNEEHNYVSSLLPIYANSDELKSLNLKQSKTIKIKTRTLDSIIESEGLNKIDLIKIDVQGAEHLVLKSAIKTLKITKLVYTEFSFRRLYQNSSTFYDLYNILNANNFMLIDISQGYKSLNGELLQGDALFVNRDFI